MQEKSTDNKVIGFLNRIIRHVATVVAVIMTLVIIWGVADIVYVLYQRLMDPAPPLCCWRSRTSLPLLALSWRC